MRETSLAFHDAHIYKCPTQKTPALISVSLTKAIEIDPNNALAYKNRGDVFYGMNRNEQAISDYTKALGNR